MEVVFGACIWNTVQCIYVNNQADMVSTLSPVSGAISQKKKKKRLCLKSLAVLQNHKLLILFTDMLPKVKECPEAKAGILKDRERGEKEDRKERVGEVRGRKEERREEEKGQWDERREG